MKRLLILVAAAAPMLLLAAGCTGGDKSTPAAGPAWVVPSGVGAEPTVPSNRTSAVPATGSSGNAGTPRCRTKDLKAATGAGEGAAGTLYVSLVFTNKSDHDCTLTGYPIVAWIAAKTGKTINKPFAPETGEPKAVVALAPGGEAHATLAYHHPGEVDPAKCKPVTVSGYRVLPPGETTSIVVKSSTVACSSSGVNPGKILAIADGEK
jgi:hypothetical protein